MSNADKKKKERTPSPWRFSYGNWAGGRGGGVRKWSSPPGTRFEWHFAHKDQGASQPGDKKGKGVFKRKGVASTRLRTQGSLGLRNRKKKKKKKKKKTANPALSPHHTKRTNSCSSKTRKGVLHIKRGGGLFLFFEKERCFRQSKTREKEGTSHSSLLP